MDMLLLMHQLGVLLLELQPLPAENELSQHPTALDATFKTINEITMTRLLSEVQVLLVQHGYTIDEQGSEYIRMIFPEKTQRQLLLPPIKNYL